ncbi:MAG TPA: AAA family ATPase [Methylomirabilota bacterium]|nr:AAA family ATPase [Methylomirabilota bacterium]
MHCPRCRHEISDSARFCIQCGARIAASCRACGAELGEGVRFCGQCGRPVDAPLTGRTRFASPETYTPRHLAEKILTSKSAIEGERKQVTVLFADLKGSMELLVDRDPEEARKVLDPVLEHMMEAVHHYEGTVNQVMGDGIMALFGAPLAHEDHAVRACYAALRMQEAVRRHAEAVRRAEGVPIQIRVGLNSGEVVVRSIGSDLRMDYTAVGQTTHLAARMEQLATPGTVLTTAETFRLAEGYVEARGLGAMPVKGLEAPFEVFEITGAGHARSRLQAGARRGLSRFVGRALELDQLHRALDQAEAGRGQVVAVVGEPGVGKSRLFHEITQAVPRPRWLALEGRAVSYGKATPYLPITDLLRGYFKVEARDGAPEIRGKVQAGLRALDPALEPSVPAFLALLDVPTEDARWQALDPSQRRQRTLEAVKVLLLRESQRQPLLVVFEDLQWVDSETQALLDGLVESLPRARMVLLANYRPEYQDGWSGKTYYTRLRLNPLAHEGAEELLQALLGAEPGLAPLKQLLIARTDGNPFFLEESVRALVETGALEGERGHYRATGPLAAHQVPATVHSILAARIDRLPAREKRLLQSASVIGKDVPFALLQALEDEPEEELREALAHLQGAEFLYETSLFPDLEYTFKHALTHEVTYGALLRRSRQALHARLVSVIERLPTGRLAEQVDRLAHHALQGGLWDKAVLLYRRAGAKAAAHSAYREAVTCSEQALHALTHLPPGKERDEQEVDLRLDLHNALTPHGEVGRMLETLHEAERVAAGLGDQRRLGQIAAYMTQGYWWSGQPDRAVESGQRALAIAGTLGDRSLAAIATLRLGQAYLSLGEYRRAIEAFSRNVASPESTPTGGAALRSAAAHAFMAWSLAYLGDFADAASHAQEAERLAESAQHDLSLALAYAGAGRPHLVQGNFPLAVSWLGRSVAICRRANFEPLFLLVASDLGQAYALSGRAEEGVALLAEATAQSAALNLRPTHAWNLTMLAEACALAGRPVEALAHVERGLAMARAHRQRWLVAEALRILGQLRSAEGAGDAARAALEEAAGIAQDIGLRPLLGRCHLSLGEALQRAGDLEAGRGHLEQAAALFREMDMRFWLGRAESALASAPSH